MCMCDVFKWRLMHAMTHIRRSEDSFGEGPLSTYMVDSGDGTQVVRVTQPVRTPAEPSISLAPGREFSVVRCTIILLIN